MASSSRTKRPSSSEHPKSSDRRKRSKRRKPSAPEAVLTRVVEVGRIFVRMVHPPGRDGTLMAVRIASVLFAFTLAAAREGRVEAPWLSSLPLKGSRVFLRLRHGLALTNARCIREALELLRGIPAEPAHHGVVVNLARVDIIVYQERPRRIGFLVSERDREWTEWVHLSGPAQRRVLRRMGRRAARTPRGRRRTPR